MNPNPRPDCELRSRPAQKQPADEPQRHTVHIGPTEGHGDQSLYGLLLMLASACFVVGIGIIIALFVFG